MKKKLYDLAEVPLKLIWLGHIHPSCNFRRSTVFMVFYLGALWLMAVLATKGIAVSYNNDIFFVAECLQTCNLMFHGSVKFLNLYLQRKHFAILLKNRSKFWQIEDFKDEHTIYKEITKFVFTFKKFLRYYYGGVIVVMITFDLQPFATGLLPTGCYVPEGWFQGLTVTLWLISFAFLCIIQGTDGFFCSLTYSLVIQFKLLSYRFKNMKLVFGNCEKKMLSELKELVDYHNFLTRYCKQLNSAFAPIFLLQFLIAIAAASVSIFIFMQPGAWTNRIKFILYYLAILVETSFYCIPSEIVVNAANDISDTLYHLEWYKIKITKFKKNFVIILARAQRSTIFSGYGLVTMNFQTFVLIVKTVFSLYTYLNSVRKIENK